MLTYSFAPFCRKNTPVGRGILQTYFDALPPLPRIVVVNLHSGGQVFAFPSEQAITEQNLLLWLKKLKAGLESHISKSSVLIYKVLYFHRVLHLNYS